MAPTPCCQRCSYHSSTNACFAPTSAALLCHSSSVELPLTNVPSLPTKSNAGEAGRICCASVLPPPGPLGTFPAHGFECCFVRSAEHLRLLYRNACSERQAPKQAAAARQSPTMRSRVLCVALTALLLFAGSSSGKTQKKAPAGAPGPRQEDAAARIS